MTYLCRMVWQPLDSGHGIALFLTMRFRKLGFLLLLCPNPAPRFSSIRLLEFLYATRALSISFLQFTANTKFFPIYGLCSNVRPFLLTVLAIVRFYWKKEACLLIHIFLRSS